MTWRKEGEEVKKISKIAWRHFWMPPYLIQLSNQGSDISEPRYFVWWESSKSGRCSNLVKIVFVDYGLERCQQLKKMITGQTGISIINFCFLLGSQMKNGQFYNKLKRGGRRGLEVEHSHGDREHSASNLTNSLNFLH